MECLLCTMWQRMPYAKKHTTPTTAAETEGALVVGYWVARNQVEPNTVPRICQRHMTVLGILDQQEERRIQVERSQYQATQPPTAYHSAEVQRLQERQQQLVAGGLPAPMPAPQTQGPVFPLTPPMMATAGVQIPASAIPAAPGPIMTASGVQVPTSAIPASAPGQAPFVLGPGPLTNGNTVSEQPQLPVPPDPIAPYVTGLAAPQAPANPQPTAPLGASKDHIENAALIDAPCLFCKVMVHAGEVHNCPLASAKGG